MGLADELGQIPTKGDVTEHPMMEPIPTELDEIRRQELLLKSGALQKAIFNSIHFSSIATDASGVIQIFNVGAERMLGFAAAEVVNRVTPADISDPQELVDRAKALSDELGTPILPGFEALVFKATRGIEDIYELTYICKDGSRIPAVVSVTALRDAHNTIIGYLLISSDNTARKQVEAEQKKLDQRLRDQQFYTRSLIESSIDALMTTDPQGIISDVNQQMEALTGCTRDELIGAPFKNYFTDAQRAEAGIRRVLNEKKLSNYELTARHREGRTTDVSYNATTFYDRERNLLGVFAAARDITERKQLDLALRSAKSAAEDANQAKSDFLSSMSHELRSPLNAILGFAQLMESAAPPPSLPQKESIDQILQAGWYLLALINEILDLSLIESGKLVLSMEAMSVADALNDCEAMIEPQARKISIRLDFPRLDGSRLDNALYVTADRTRLKQVFVNLLSNAIKYNRPGGTVAVRCDVIAAMGAKGGPVVRISFRDNGAGLSADKLAQLFQPFNRLGQESGAEEGTGIGLVVSKRLVELMGGAIGVESTEGVGSLFWVDLACAQASDLVAHPHELASLPPAQMAAGERQFTVLYVEDNPANLMLVEKLLARRPGWSLLTATDGARGIEMARQAQPDVVLMDINLPGINGFQAMAMLAADLSTAHIPVVALSANAMRHDIDRGRGAGFFRYLTKPIKVAVLMATLEEALALTAPSPDEPQQEELT